jgi:molybdenum cofactor guanylyltransferase
VQRRVTGVILAGGQSERFGGKDKAFAIWEGRPFLARVGEAVRSVSDGILILAPAGADGVTYARHVPGATVVPDRAAGRGPVEALRGAAVLLRTPTVLVAPCDAPGLTPALARRLVALSEEGKRPAVAASQAEPIWTLFATPLELLMERLPGAKRMEDLVAGAEHVATELEGLNVNEPPVRRSRPT